MLRFVAGLFIVLHGLVYLLYSGHSRRLFELRPGLAWPDGSWAFSKLLGDEATRTLASVSYILIAIGFVAGGIGFLTGQSWWRPVVVGAAAVSAILIVLFWDGEMKMLDAKGGIGLLINLAILASLVILR
jgi:hypothetical protein